MNAKTWNDTEKDILRFLLSRFTGRFAGMTEDYELLNRITKRISVRSANGRTGATKNCGTRVRRKERYHKKQKPGT